eukprot:scaffold225004_cov32-Tisochrysis_lutea.AAC.1
MRVPTAVLTTDSARGQPKLAAPQTMGGCARRGQTRIYHGHDYPPIVGARAARTPHSFWPGSSSSGAVRPLPPGAACLARWSSKHAMGGKDTIKEEGRRGGRGGRGGRGRKGRRWIGGGSGSAGSPRGLT